MGRGGDLYDGKTMFIDEARLHLKAGAGGNGAVSFRRETHVPRGGPDGGHGGRGGSIYLVADAQHGTLIDYRHVSRVTAERGGHGGGNRKHGKNAADIELPVPVGTVVYDDETGDLLADLVYAGQRFRAAAGGGGGRGNSVFVSSTRQAPRFSEKGMPGEERTVRLEMKLLADVALIGMPNAGKSSLISRISAARPKVADYPFTTLVPNLGVVQIEPGKSYVVADIPGLIEGASEGAGLGHQFLRHIERTRLLVHLVDVSGLTMRDPLDDWRVVNNELSGYSDLLAGLPQVVVLNKMDSPDAPELADQVERRMQDEGAAEILRVSALSGEGVDALKYYLYERLSALPPAEQPAAVPQAVFHGPKSTSLEVVREAGVFVVRGAEVERAVARTDMSNDAAVRRLQRILDQMGVDSRLRDLGAVNGDQVRIGTMEFDFVE